MVMATGKHDVRWLSAEPLWTKLSDSQMDPADSPFVKPSILRFKNDEFMDEAMSLLSYHPERLVEWQVLPETWRAPMPEPTATAYMPRNEPVSAFSKQKNELARARGLDQKIENAYRPPDPETIDYKQLKLYQPAHQRYYLVTASLVCAQPGFPDRAVQDNKQERVGYVLRRIVNNDENADSAWCDPINGQCTEYAFVQTAKGPRWRKLGSGEALPVDRLAPEEERLPLFALNYQSHRSHGRRLLAGMIPVSGRERYINAPEHTGASPGEVDAEAGDQQEETDPRVTLFMIDVAERWKALLSQAATESGSFDKAADLFADRFDDSGDGSDGEARLKRSREQIQTISWYILLDFERFLHRYLKPVWEVLAGVRAEADLTTDEERNLVTILKNTTLGSSIASELLEGTYHTESDIKDTLFDALQALAENPAIGDGLEAVDVNYDRNPVDDDDSPTNESIDSRWPDFLFPLADPAREVSGPAPAVTLSDENSDGAALERNRRKVDALVDRIAAVLAVNGAPGRPEVPEDEPTRLDNRAAWFVIRCVYERPNCGPFHREIVSLPTRPFQMAAFFDPDAPGRPIKVPMPMDISPAGLRKYSRNTKFMISDMLCGKISNMRKLTLKDLVLSVLPWPLHKGLPKAKPAGPCKGDEGNFGMFCSLSIPIVTICAMILLIIMVTLFDIFFRWLPYLFFCLPIPGLKGKNS